MFYFKNIIRSSKINTTSSRTSIFDTYWWGFFHLFLIYCNTYINWHLYIRISLDTSIYVYHLTPLYTYITWHLYIRISLDTSIYVYHLTPLYTYITWHLYVRISLDTSMYNVYTLRIIKMSLKEMTTVETTIYIEYSAYKIFEVIRIKTEFITRLNIALLFKWNKSIIIMTMKWNFCNARSPF